jgi:NTP pyrophosphatase (non-canonical NTP hydrolase)
LRLSEYQSETARTDITPSGIGGEHILLLGLFGEAGSLLSALKKHLREKESFASYKAVVEEELGDCLWYLSSVCRRHGTSLQDLADEIARQTFPTSNNAPGSMTLAELQALVTPGMTKLVEFENELLRLGATAGKVLQLAQEKSRAVEYEAVLREMLLVIVHAAARGGVCLEKAVRQNLAKNRSRWPGSEPQYPPLFDIDMPDIEQIPRALRIEFRQYEQHNRVFIIQRCNGINIGDRLTDNHIDPDYYRYHDVFHIAYATHLGWSPVLRALFKVKRKSIPAIDDAQDGARAIIIEEGISTWIFGRAAGLRYFEGINSVDYSMLKSVQDFATGYEVEACKLWQWERAILDGFRIFRELRANHHGLVVADLNQHTLEFHPQ